MAPEFASCYVGRVGCLRHAAVARRDQAARAAREPVLARAEPRRREAAALPALRRARDPVDCDAAERRRRPADAQQGGADDAAHVRDGAAVGAPRAAAEAAAEGETAAWRRRGGAAARRRGVAASRRCL